MTSAPSVTVVIATYQRSASLARTLDAIRSCASPPGGFEVVVVDDGSRDGTKDVVESAPLPVRYIWQENAGPAAARNRGWRDARGELVLFTDDDTVPEREWMVDLVEAIGSAPDFGGVGGHVVPLQRGWVEDFVQAERLVRHAVDDDGTVRYLVTANALYRRGVLEQAGGFDESFPTPAGEDVDLSYRVREAGWRLGAIDGGVVAHEHPRSFRQVLRTFRRHGEARNQLAARHSSASTASAAAGVIAPAAWVARYRRYRGEGVTPVRAVVFLAMRVAGLGAYLVGVVRSRRSRATDGATCTGVPKE